MGKELLVPVAVSSDLLHPQNASSHLCARVMADLLSSISGATGVLSDISEDLPIVLERAISMASLEAYACQFCPKAHVIIR